MVFVRNSAHFWVIRAVSPLFKAAKIGISTLKGLASTYFFSLSGKRLSWRERVWAAIYIFAANFYYEEDPIHRQSYFRQWSQDSN